MIGLSLLTFGRREIDRLGSELFPLALITAVWVFVCIFLAVLVHELGHVWAGKRARFEFQSMSVGRIEWRKINGKITVHRIRDARTAGFTRMVPSDAENLVSRMMLFILGGPLASLFFCALTYVAFLVTPDRLRGGEMVAILPHVLSLVLFVMSISVLPGTLVPFTSSSGNMTDMKALLALAGKEEGRERIVAFLLLSRDIVSGLRAREWNGSVLEAASKLTDGSAEELRARIFAYYHHDDLGNSDAADRDLRRCLKIAERLKGKGGILREIAYLESAYDAAWRRGDLGLAKRRLEEAEPVSESLLGTRALAQAAVAAREGDVAETECLLQEAETRLKEVSARYGGSIAYDLERVALVRGSLSAVSTL